jgi:hypothetical protein
MGRHQDAESRTEKSKSKSRGAKAWKLGGDVRVDNVRIKPGPKPHKPLEEDDEAGGWARVDEDGWARGGYYNDWAARARAGA